MIESRQGSDSGAHYESQPRHVSVKPIAGPLGIDYITLLTLQLLTYLGQSTASGNLITLLKFWHLYSWLASHLRTGSNLQPPFPILLFQLLRQLPSLPDHPTWPSP